MSRRFLVIFAVVGLGGIGLLAPAVSAASVATGEHRIEVVPVQGQAVDNGMTLHVHVFYAKGGHPGPPPGHGGSGGTVNCTNDDSQTGFATPFANAQPITMHVNEGTVPQALSVNTALGAAEQSWNHAGARLGLQLNGSQTSPAQDGVSTIGWAHLVPKNVLAATWTWTDSSNNVVEADLFFNNIQPWATFTSCPTTATGNFDVADIATHELGHVLGLEHYSDSGAQATMYPSAPPDEVRKVSLTAGDTAALKVALGH